MLLAAGMTFLLESARTSFELLLSIGAGSGLLYLLRWYWWRINAWSEIAAMAVSFVVADRLLRRRQDGQRVSAQHRAARHRVCDDRRVDRRDAADASGKRATLIGFYRLVRPAGPGWGPIPAKAGVGPSPDSISLQLLGWVLGCTFVYATLFGAGSALYGHTTQAIVCGVVWVVSGVGLVRMLTLSGRATRNIL